jgi:hypothetical protein
MKRSPWVVPASDPGSGAERPCYRNVDQPILLLGLEYMDWAMVLVVFGGCALLPYISNLTVLLITVICATALRVLKASKPRGYLLHLCYRLGVPLPGILPPPCVVPRYSACARSLMPVAARRRSLMNRFVDFWVNQEETIGRLRTAFYATLLVAGIEAWGLVAMARQPAPVYVVPGATKSGLYRADDTWQEAAKDFAQGYVLTSGNFTPESAPQAFAAALRYLAPGALSTARATLEGDLARIRRDRISSACTIMGEVRSALQDDRMLVTVPGHKRIHAGRELISEKPVTYQLTVALVPKTAVSPQGMQLIEVQQREATAQNTHEKNNDTNTAHESHLDAPRG